MRHARSLLLALLTTLVPTVWSPPAMAAIDTTAQGELNRRLTLLAFSDDGSRALLLERAGWGPWNEAVWIVDKDGVVEVLPLGTRGPTARPGVAIRAGRDDRDLCRASAERLSDMAADFDQISVRVGSCGMTSAPVVTPMRNQAPLIPSSDLGIIHRRLGFAGRTFIAPRGPTRDTGPLVVVIGVDLFGNDRVGATVKER